MNAENQIICERVLSATAKIMTLGGSPHPYLEFRDSMPIGGIVVYELRYITRSLFSILVEIGVAAYAFDNTLRRISVVRSVNGKRATRIAGGESQQGTYFVRASRNDLLDSLEMKSISENQISRKEVSTNAPIHRFFRSLRLGGFAA